MKELVIHAGIHKTGSTAIQIALFHQPEVFAKHGVYYPKTGIFDGAHHQLARAAREPAWNPELFKQLRQEIQGQEGTVVLSSEDFDSLDAAGVERLHAEVAPLCKNIRVLIYLRPQYSLIRSQYSQQIREAFARDSFDAFFKRALQHARFLRLIELCRPWATQFGKANVTVRSAVRKNLVDGSALSDFIAFLGLDKKINARDFTGTDAANESLTLLQCDVLRELSRTQPFWELPFARRREVFVRLFRGCDNLQKLSALADPFDFRGIELCRNLYASYNQQLAAEFFGGPDHFNAWYEETLAAAEEGGSRPNFAQVGRIDWVDIYRQFIRELSAELRPAAASVKEASPS